MTHLKNTEVIRLTGELEKIIKNNIMLELIRKQYEREIDRRMVKLA